MKRWKWMKMLLILILFLLIVRGCISAYEYYLGRIPDSINLKAGTEQTIEFCVPVSGTIMPESVSAWNGISEENMTKAVEVDFSHPFTIITGESNQYTAKLRLFGIFPYKTVSIQVIEEEMLIPAGVMVGIYVETDGVLVIDTGEFQGEDGAECAPAREVIEPGDYITAVDGVTINKKAEFIDIVSLCEGKTLEVTLRRNGEEITVLLTPRKNSQGEYKVGIWIRDSAQGIGTMTYLDTAYNFGSLGHGITDFDTGELMDMANGELYISEIVSIQKGITGEPGEITGMIHYVQDNILGNIEYNTDKGVFGHCEALPAGIVAQPMSIAYKNEIHTGPAQILCNVTGEVAYYDIEIKEIYLSNMDHRGLVIEVVDEDLLAQTGGIVQGMSGSPIIQDDKIVGAVTHVLVNDPTRGYGIFIEEMLEH